MIRVFKWNSVVLYGLAAMFLVIGILGVMWQAPLGTEFGCGCLIIVCFLAASRLYKVYIKQLKKYRDLLRNSDVERIDYRIYSSRNIRGKSYKLEFYINGEKFIVPVAKSQCRGNKMKQYYLKPLYKKNGEFKDFRIYMDKCDAWDKERNYMREVKEFDEQNRKQQNI
jgi:hypothetical protein